jgi:hypothetical protein
MCILENTEGFLACVCALLSPGESEGVNRHTSFVPESWYLRLLLKISDKCMA